MDFSRYLEELNIVPTEDILKKFDIYYEYLIEVNEYMNLTAITKEDEVYIKHFYDSLLLTKCYDVKSKEITLCDVGAGAGFPSIPLAICFPNIKVTIIDALQKRIGFLNALIDKLGLKNVEASHYRAEDFAKIKREEFDIVTARAVARLNLLSELCIPLVKLGGNFIALKGDDKDEIDEAKGAINTLGAKYSNEFDLTLPCSMGKRTIIIYNKVKETPKKYPRAFANIKKAPLKWGG